MKILNLYAGIGGNRLLWNEVNPNIEVVAVELNDEIAKAYSDRFTNDTVIVGNAKEYLLEHYNDFDFIWASPPCQSHSRIRYCKVDCRENSRGSIKAVYPDMSLWEMIIFLRHHTKAKWIVENVIPYYSPLIRPTVAIDRHLYWSNFAISPIEVEKERIIEKVKASEFKEFDLSPYKIKNKVQVIRNQVNSQIGKYIFSCLNNNTNKFKSNTLNLLDFIY